MKRQIKWTHVWKSALFFALMVLALAVAPQTHAAPRATCVAALNNMGWNNPLGWSCGGVQRAPFAGEDVIVNTNVTLYVNQNTPAIASLTILSGATLSAYTGLNNITFTGDFTNNGTLASTFGTGKLSMYYAGTGTSYVSGTGAINFYNLLVQDGYLGLSKSVTVDDEIIVQNGGQLALGSYTANASGDACVGCRLTVQNGGALYIGGTNTLPTFTNYTLGATSDVRYIGTTQTVAAGVTYGLLTLSGGTKTLGGATTIAGDLTIASTATLDTSASNYALNVAGDFSNSGTFTPRSGTVTFNGTAAQAITGATTFNNLTINNTAATPSDTADVNTSAAVTVSNLLTVTDGQFRPATSSVFNDVTIGTNGIFKPAESASVSVSGDFARTGTFTHNSGTVTFNGSAAQAITGASTFNNLTVSNTGSTVHLGANQTIAGNLSVTSGTLNLNTYTANRSAAGGTLSVSNGASLLIGGTNTLPASYSANTFGATSTAVYSGTTQTVGGTTYGILNLSGGTKTLGGITTVAGDLTIASGATLDTSSANSYALNLAGDFSNSGAFTARSGTVTFNGSAAQAITGATTFYNLTINNTAGTPSDSADVNTSAAVTVANLLTVNDGQFRPATSSVFCDVTISTNGIFKPAASASISVCGHFRPTGTFTHNSGTVTFNGSTTQPISGTTTFYNLTISNTAATPSDSADVNTNAAVTVTNLLTVTDGQFRPATSSVFNAVSIGASGIFKPAASVSVSGGWTNSGTFTHNSGTVTFNGSAVQTITGASTFNNLTVSNTGSTVHLGANQTMDGNLSVTSGTLNLNTYTANRSAAGGTLSVSNGASLLIGGTNGLPANYSANTFGATSTAVYSGTTQTVGGTTYGILNLSGGTKTLGGITTVAGDLTIASGATLDTSSANSYALNLTSDLINSGTFTPRNGTVTFNGAATQAITGTVTFYNLTINNTAATPSDTANVYSSAATTVSNLLTVTDGQFRPFTGSSFNDITVSANGIFKPAASSTVNISGDWTTTGTFTHNNSTITLNGTGQIMTGTTTFNNLTLNANANTTTNSNVTVTGTLTLGADLTASGTNAVILGASSVIAGANDIVGIARRTSPAAGSALKYNNQYTTINNANALTQMDVKLTKASPTLAKAVTRYYTLTPGTGTISATIQLAYKSTELNGTTEANVRLFRYDTTLSKWVLKGGTVNTTNHFVSLAGVTQFSDWAITDTGNPTSVTLSTFNAQASDNSGMGILIAALCAGFITLGWFALKMQKR